jgi:Putative lumazine-binding
MKYFLILLTVLVFSITIYAQTAEDSVKAAVNKMFTGMKSADAALLNSSFADSAILQTIAGNKDGSIVIKNESTADFIDFVSKLAPGVADERISFETIKIDGPLATAWTPYNFYYNGKFSHCGVNSFQLVRLRGEWKIQYIIDTRRKEGCSSQ